MDLDRLLDSVASLGALVGPELDTIATSTGEAASAVVLSGRGCDLVGFRPGTEEITLKVPQWHWDLALRLATGRMLVAFEPEDVADMHIAKHVEDNGRITVRAWRKRLAQYRADEAASILPEENPHAYVVATPVRMRGGRGVAAIGASAPAFRADERHRRKMLQAVRAACASVSRKLGFESP